MVKHEGPLVNRATLEIFELSAKKGWECGEKQLKLHRASGSGRWISIEKDVVRAGRTKASVDQRTKRRCWNQYVARSFVSQALPSLARGKTFVTC